MSTVKINNKTYEVPELSFEHSKILEQYGVPLFRMNDPNLLFTCVGAFVSIVVGCNSEHVDYLMEQHVLGGGTLDEIYGAYIQAITDSGFFKTLLENMENQEKKRIVQKTKNSPIQTK